MSRSTQGHYLNKFGSTRPPNAAYQVSRSSAFWFGRRRFFKVSTIYGHGNHLGHVTRTIWTNFHSPISRRLHMEFGFNRSSGFRGEAVWKCWHTYIHTHDRGLPLLQTRTQSGCGVRTHPLSWANYFKIMQFFTRNWVYTPNFGLKIRFFLRFTPPPPL